MDRDPERPCQACTLFLPLADRVSAWLACGALFAAYCATMSRDLSYYDSSELALAAVQLGLGHPPGQPLHTLIGHAFAQLPFLAPLAGVTLASALPAALTLIPATSLAQGLADPQAPVIARRILPWLLAAVGLHPALWEPATRVEVYPLAVFFAVWALARLAAPCREGERAPRRVFTAAVALGLCASVNPMIAVCTALAVAPAVLGSVLRREMPLWVLPAALAGGVLGLLPYAYVPLIAQRDGVMVWGAPRDAERLWFYLTLRDYAHNKTVTLASWLSHLAAWTRYSLERGVWFWLVLGLAGHLWLGARTGLKRLTAPLLLGLLASVIASNVIFHEQVPDYDGYLASPLWLCAAGAGALWLQAYTARRTRLLHALAVLLALCALLAPPHLLARTRQRDHVARTLAEQVLREAPPNAVVITNLDVYAGALFYLQQAEGVRPDVVVLAYGLASSSWHWEQLYALHPELARFSLRGPGGRAARVRRFLQVHPERAVLVEDVDIARAVGLSACAGGLYLQSGARCKGEYVDDAGPLAAAARLGRARDNVGEGAPSAVGALSQVTYLAGVSLWRLGQPRAAYAMLLAGVPRRLLPRGTGGAPAGLQAAPPLAGPLPAWRRPAALGDPARNLWLAGAIAHAAGLRAPALTLRRAAARTGLPEARAIVP